MAPSFQSSFIPKEPVTEEVFKKKKAGILGTFVVLLFIVSIVASVALYVYKGIVSSSVQSMKSELDSAEKSLDTNSISQMTQFSKKLDMVDSLIEKHKVVSGFLATLASSTVSSVQFTQFEYDSGNNNSLSVTLHGKSTDYASIALQESVFNQDKHFKKLQFSNLTLSDSGSVVFNLAMTVDPSIADYMP